MIETIHLHKRYGTKTAVVDLNLSIEPGVFFCFLGPNGAGKTTTIKMLTGLLIPTSGEARVAGHDLQKEPVAAKQSIGYVPDRPYLYEKLSGRDFMLFTADLFGIERERCEAAMKEYFGLFRLTEVADQFIENYSHGMRQKLVLAAQLMHEPQVVIVDEPMVGLDPQSARTIKRLLRQQANSGKTIFLSTHTLSVAEELADRIGVINRGELIFDGTIDKLRGELASAGNLEEMFLRLTEDAEAEPAEEAEA